MHHGLSRHEAGKYGDNLTNVRVLEVATTLQGLPTGLFTLAGGNFTGPTLHQIRNAGRTVAPEGKPLRIWVMNWEQNSVQKNQRHDLE